MSDLAERFLELFGSVTVIDTETTGKEAEECELVEIATGRFVDGDWKVKSELFKTINPIPPEASSVHHISNKMVADKSTLEEFGFIELADLIEHGVTKFYVAHNSEFDRTVLKSNFDRINTKADKLNSKDSWICTWRLTKAVFVGNDSMQYGLGYLRYYLELDIPKDMEAHRAEADVLTDARLFERLTLEAVEKGLVDPDAELGPQLHKLCWDPIPILTWPLGVHKGKNLEDLPTRYYLWAVENLNGLKEGEWNYDMDLAEAVGKELEKRMKAGDPALKF